MTKQQKQAPLLYLPNNGKVTTHQPVAKETTVCLFAYAGVVPETTDCLIRDATRWPGMVYFRTSADALIDRARSRAASAFLMGEREEVGDVLIMIDHDLIWPEGALQRLAASCQKTKGIVAGIYSKRQFGAGVTVRFTEEGVHAIGEDRLVACDYVSTGFFAIHREVLERMALSPETPFMEIGNFWPFFIPAIARREIAGQVLHEELSEDWAFCRRATELGFTVHADLAIELIHMGEYGYRIVDAMTAPHPNVPASFTVVNEEKDPPVFLLYRDLAKYVNIAPDQVHAAVTEARQQLTTLWAAFGGHEVENEWYRRDDVGRAYIFDLADWHTLAISRILHEELKPAIPKLGRVLDFGSGIGTMALMSAWNGAAEVEYFEPNEAMKKFLNYRLSLSEFTAAASVMKEVEITAGLYDLIICWHVLEHVADPEAVVAKLVSHLAPGGAIFTDSDFHIDVLHAMHYERVEGKKDGSDLWEAAGLVRDGDTHIFHMR